MRILPQDIKAKPYYAFTFVQGQEQRTLQVSGHASMQAAKRASSKIMRELRDHVEGEPRNTKRPLMTWGHGKVEDYEREHGIVV